MRTSKQHPMTPVVPPRLISDFYTPAEVDSLFGFIRRRGPWQLVLAQHFASTEEYLAISGAGDRNPNARLADFTAPVFRGYLAKEGIAMDESIHDIYFGRKLLDPIKKMHGARYGFAHHMLFNTCGPSRSFDAGHFDTGNWRGRDVINTPVWLLGVMAKSGLFDRWEIKTGQMITYFYDSDIDGGFTYWPAGPDRAPSRFEAPFRNTAILTDNSRMYHRREANGPRDHRDFPALEMHSLLHRDQDEWAIRNGDTEIARYRDEESRTLFHYTALVFDDAAEVNRYLDHTDDLSLDTVFEMLAADLRTRGIRYTEPTAPLTDPEFIALLTDTYAMAPREYPVEAPLDVPLG
ncbi:hypothetical protein [Nocardia sp. NPDC004123]